MRARVALLKDAGRSEAAALEDVHRTVHGILPDGGEPTVSMRIRDKVISTVSAACFEEYHREHGPRRADTG